MASRFGRRAVAPQRPTSTCQQGLSFAAFIPRQNSNRLEGERTTQSSACAWVGLLGAHWKESSSVALNCAHGPGRRSLGHTPAKTRNPQNSPGPGPPAYFAPGSNRPVAGGPTARVDRDSARRVAAHCSGNDSKSIALQTASVEIGRLVQPRASATVLQSRPGRGAFCCCIRPPQHPLGTYRTGRNSVGAKKASMGLPTAP